MRKTSDNLVPPELDQSSYHYACPGEGWSHSYVLPELIRLLARFAGHDCRIFEIGSGNGFIAGSLSELGYSVVGVEPSRQGVSIARQANPDLKVFEGSGYDDLARQYGTYPVVISLEVIEHVYAPRLFARNCYELLEPGGILILSTPYHGYWKNLALALTGKLDAHFTALWDHGHIKFWSVKTLTTLLKEAGFQDVRFSRIGRISPVAKTMFAIATKPLKPLTT